MWEQSANKVKTLPSYLATWSADTIRYHTSCSSDENIIYFRLREDKKNRLMPTDNEQHFRLDRKCDNFSFSHSVWLSAFLLRMRIEIAMRDGTQIAAS